MNPTIDQTGKSTAKSIWIAILCILVLALGFAAFYFYQKNETLQAQNDQLALQVSQNSADLNSSDASDQDGFKLMSPPHNNEQFGVSDHDAYWVSMDYVSNKPAGFKVFKGSLMPSIYSSDDRQYLTYAYATDGEKVFYKGFDVYYADPATFEPIENGRAMHFYGKDSKSAYYTNFRLEGSDPKTFKILWTVPPEGCSQAQYSVDAKHVYFESKLIEGADPASFEVLSDEYGKDKNRVYHKDTVQPGVIPKGFVPPQTCEYGN